MARLRARQPENGENGRLVDGNGSPTDVIIFGRTYSLRGERRPEDLRRLARLVDSRMREIAADPMRADGLKVAVLAAINFADEIEKHRQRNEEREGRVGEISTRLSAVLADCLDAEEGTDAPAAAAERPRPEGLPPGKNASGGELEAGLP